MDIAGVRLSDRKGGIGGPPGILPVYAEGQMLSVILLQPGGLGDVDHEHLALIAACFASPAAQVHILGSIQHNQPERLAGIAVALVGVRKALESDNFVIAVKVNGSGEYDPVSVRSGDSGLRRDCGSGFGRRFRFIPAFPPRPAPPPEWG